MNTLKVIRQCDESDQVKSKWEPSLESIKSGVAGPAFKTLLLLWATERLGTLSTPQRTLLTTECTNMQHVLLEELGRVVQASLVWSRLQEFLESARKYTKPKHLNHIVETASNLRVVEDVEKHPDTAKVMIQAAGYGDAKAALQLL